MTDHAAETHRMVPGTHEWPRTPECVCGAEWSRWHDTCASLGLIPTTPNQEQNR